MLLGGCLINLMAERSRPTVRISGRPAESMAHQVATITNALFEGSRKLETEVQGFLSEVRNG